MRPRSILTAGILGAAGAVLWSRYAAALRLHRERIGRGSQAMTSSFGRLEFATAGEGEPVLVSHGAGGGFDQALAIGAPLAAAGHRVIAPSRFGYLRSGSPTDPSPACQADAFAELLDHLNIARADVVGVSAGALSALQLAVRHPDRCRSLAVLVPALSVTPTAAQGSLPRMSATTRAVLERMTASDLLFWLGATFAPGLMTRTVLGTPPALVRAASANDRRRVDQILWSVLPISERTQGLANDRRFTSSPQAIAVDRIAAPTLVVSFDDDLYRTDEAARFLASAIHGARLRMYPSGGHMWVGHDQEVVAEVLALLGAAAAAPAGAEAAPS